MALQLRRRVEPGAVRALLRLLFDHILETVHQYGYELKAVPHAEDAQERRIGEQHQRVERHQAADAQCVVNDRQRSAEQKNRVHHIRGDVDQTLVDHRDQVPPEELCPQLGEFGRHPLAQPLFGAHRLHGGYAADRVDLA
jgi:hypothetical protein